MGKTIQEQISEMEARCNQLEELQKLFDKAVKMQFGMDSKKIQQLIENTSQKPSDFERKISTYFGLKTDSDYKEFLQIFCSETTLNYYKNSLGKWYFQFKKGVVNASHLRRGKVPFVSTDLSVETMPGRKKITDYQKCYFLS